MEPKGDVGETARRRLALRPKRSDEELRKLVEAMRQTVEATFAQQPSAPFVADPGDGRRRLREAVASKEIVGDQLRLEVIAAALEHLSFTQLWWLLHWFDETRQSDRAAKGMLERAEERAAVAFQRLRAFTSSVAGIVQNADSRRELDGVERELLTLAAWEADGVRVAGAVVAGVERENGRVITARQREAARRLRAAIPIAAMSWRRIADLVIASAALQPHPCPDFVDANEDPTKLEWRLKQLVRDRRA